MQKIFISEYGHCHRKNQQENHKEQSNAPLVTDQKSKGTNRSRMAIPRINIVETQNRAMKNISRNSTYMVTDQKNQAIKHHNPSHYITIATIIENIHSVNNSY